MANIGYPDPVGVLPGERTGSERFASLEYRCVYCDEARETWGKEVYVTDTGTWRFVRVGAAPRCRHHDLPLVSINACYARRY